MRVVPDLIGQTFGRWNVVARAGRSRSGEPLWTCKCSCGTTRDVIGNRLKRGATKSCGCASLEAAVIATKKHGMWNTPEYRAWQQLKKRCLNPRDKDFPDYGGRGIKVDQRWVESFESFYNDMGPRPSKMHSIDRKDVDGNYEPTNCRWATRKEQQNNRRTPKNNKSGIAGVLRVKKGNVFTWRVTMAGYATTRADFFEACCLRKSLEAKFKE